MESQTRDAAAEIAGRSRLLQKKPARRALSAGSLEEVEFSMQRSVGIWNLEFRIFNPILSQTLNPSSRRRPSQRGAGLLLKLSEDNTMRAPQSTIVGVFDDRLQADRAVDELRRAGFRDDQIGVAMRHDPGEIAAADAVATDETHAGTGAVAGVLAGLGLGALAGLGVLSGVIPVVGPAIAGGTLGIILSNAAVGAGVGGLVGVLVGAGIPEAEAHYYQGEFESGRTIVTVRADGRGDEAMAILRRYNAYDMSTRPDHSGTMASAANQPVDIPIHSEDVIVGGRTADMEDTVDRGTGRTVL